MGHQFSKLLMDESPLQVLPGLAVLIGLDEAIFLQQLHFKLYHVIKSNGREFGAIREGRPYYYNSIANWRRFEFPFWSEPTLKRIIRRLGPGAYKGTAGGKPVQMQGLGLVETCKFLEPTRREDGAPDQTNWYTIDYERLEEILETGTLNPDLQPDSPSDQSDPMEAPLDQSDLPHRITVTPPLGHFDPMLKGIREDSEIPTEIKESGANFGPPPGGIEGLPVSIEDAWEAIKSQLQAEMARGMYQVYVDPLRPAAIRRGVEGRLAYRLNAANRDAGAWVHSRLGARITGLLEMQYFQPVELEISAP